MIRRRGIAGVCFALGALIALASAADASAGVPKGFFGVVSQAPLEGNDFERMGQARVGTLRVEISWSGVDSTSAPGDYDWSAPDQLIGSAARNGVRVLPFVYGTPARVAKLDGHECDDSCGLFAPKGAAALSAWRDFLAAAVRRYGPNGQFWAEHPEIPELPIRAWQLWNEQNSPTFYEPKPDPKAYAKLVKAGNEAIGAEDPKAEVVLGGMFGTPLNGRKPGISAWNFLERVYRVKGAKKSFDGVAPHPYAAQLSKVIAQIDLLRDEIKDAGDGGADLWITELGWASGGPANPLNRGLQGQADRLTEAFKYLKKRRNKLNIRTVNWFSWRDNTAPHAAVCEWCPESGLLTESLEEKPSYRAFTRFTNGS